MAKLDSMVLDLHEKVKHLSDVIEDQKKEIESLRNTLEETQNILIVAINRISAMDLIVSRFDYKEYRRDDDIIEM